MFMEEWSSISGYPGYTVSSKGRVCSEMRGKPRILRTFYSHGYERVTLVCAETKKRTKHFIHRLVAMAFHGEPHDIALVVAHLDGDPTNNARDNLRWVTHEENCAHKYLHGTLLQGQQLATAKLTAGDVGMIRRRHREGSSKRELAREYDVDPKTIRAILNFETWKWVGTWEEFEDPFLGGPAPLSTSTSAQKPDIPGYSTCFTGSPHEEDQTSGGDSSSVTPF